LTMIFLGGINLITSPSVIWSVFPAFVLIWWPLSIIFINKKKKILAEESND